MTDLLEAALLGLVQGLTEFLPISSSGHLAILQKLLGWTDPEGNLAFNVAVHLGSLLAVLVFVGKEIRLMFTTRPRLLVVLILATLPIALAGPFLKDLVKDVNATLWAVGLFLIGTGAVLLLVRRAEGGRTDTADLSLPRALAVGVAQVFAILPGVSRSGMTLAAGLKAGLEREQAVRFAFLMAAPAIAGAGLFMAVGGEWGGSIDAGPVLAGALVSFAASLVAMKVLVVVVARRRLGWFALYCACAGVFAIVLS